MGIVVFRDIHHAKLMGKTGFLRNDVEIIKTGGHKSIGSLHYVGESRVSTLNNMKDIIRIKN